MKIEQTQTKKVNRYSDMQAIAPHTPAQALGCHLQAQEHPTNPTKHPAKRSGRDLTPDPPLLKGPPHSRSSWAALAWREAAGVCVYWGPLCLGQTKIKLWIPHCRVCLQLQRKERHNPPSHPPAPPTHLNTHTSTELQPPTQKSHTPTNTTNTYHPVTPTTTHHAPPTQNLPTHPPTMASGSARLASSQFLSGSVLALPL